jgi:hypothetical protein
MFDENGIRFCPLTLNQKKIFGGTGVSPVRAQAKACGYI